MGLPIGKLIVATNENDILHRFFTKGEYHREPIAKSISPSMDICVSSNFERYLFHLAGNDSSKVADWMKTFETTKKLDISGDLLEQAKADFASARADTSMTLDVIRDYNEKYNYVLCPHSAVGISAIQQLGEVNGSMVCLATAHDGKFPAAVKQAIDPLPEAPKELACLLELPTRVSECANDLKSVQDFMEKRIEERITAQA
jgi:threonine synthase